MMQLMLKQRQSPELQNYEVQHRTFLEVARGHLFNDVECGNCGCIQKVKAGEKPTPCCFEVKDGNIKVNVVEGSGRKYRCGQ